LDLTSSIVLVPHVGRIEPPCSDGLRELERSGVRVVRRPDSSQIDVARNELLSDALHDGFKSSLFIDPGIGFDPEDARRLLARPRAGRLALPDRRRRICPREPARRGVPAARPVGRLRPRPRASPAPGLGRVGPVRLRALRLRGRRSGRGGSGGPEAETEAEGAGTDRGPGDGRKSGFGPGAGPPRAVQGGSGGGPRPIRPGPEPGPAPGAGVDLPGTTHAPRGRGACRAPPGDGRPQRPARSPGRRLGLLGDGGLGVGSSARRGGGRLGRGDPAADR